MRRFQFRLQTVLRHRQTLEDQREREFGEAQARVQRAEARYREIEEQCLAVLGERGATKNQSQRLDIHALLERERYVESLKRQMESVQREIDAAKIVAEEAREILVKARQDREAVSKIRETALEEHEKEMLRLDQEAFDEMAGIRYARQSRQGEERLC